MPSQRTVLCGQSFDWCLIPAGTCIIGSANPAYAEGPPHPVTFTRPCYLGTFPVSQAQFQSVMGHNPSAFRLSGQHPVDSVSWDLAVEFCQRLSLLAGRTLRLPSEAEWEFACRAGTAGEFFFHPAGPFADETTIPPAVQQALLDYAWFADNSGGTTHPLGLKRPNNFGLHDMLGNVWEWCADVWHAEYPHDVSAVGGDGAEQPRGALRGGAFDMDAFRCRSCYRSCDFRHLGKSSFGFRLAADELPPARPSS